MKLLLDTHCWLWMQASPGMFAPAVRAILEDPGHELLLSSASVWEVSIKWSLGKLPLPEAPAIYVPRCLDRQGVRALPIHNAHVLRVSTLPVFPDHRDPFDRLLIAQADVEGLCLLTADTKNLDRYRGLVELLKAR
ncbi:type II toxin-antitoxin system VapC family toxin [Paraliomyxa miuraensis]|uniref:type II toxin-antitoxin system VapC family toxin n=1 Tax=Paraliomyxa miuraensis TaxID=376150 RepID=UPI002258BC45|nr:type II toxin-antitoxin system VapC family toxin [Paraliomyxa miuraensis]MCX4242710.1 type II toxin-antitoxin system VapC family toxin [Paraliomyxa miuraensis]